MIPTTWYVALFLELFYSIQKVFTSNVVFQFICEMEVNENDNAENRLTPNTTLTDDDATEEDSELMNADEEDKCYILGSIWGERLKLVPLNLRFVVRRLIDQIFEEARTGKLTG